MDTFIFIVYFVLLCIATYFDIRYQIIPNVLNGVAILLGFCMNFVANQGQGIVYSSIGFATLLITAIALYLIKAIAAGDVKWFAATGSFLGFKLSFMVLFTSIFISALIAMIILFVIALKKKEKIKHFPFMYAVLPSYILIWWYVS
jgi:prepilin peptidase CpaA